LGLGLSKVCGEWKEEGWISVGDVDSVWLCSYAVWQYREEGIAGDSRRILLKNAVMMGS
jgi:hypothetical protein